MNILFPYEKIRNTQENFIKEILNSLETKKNIIAHVPVGVGKTAAIFSSIIPLLLKKDSLTLLDFELKYFQEELKLIKSNTKLIIINFPSLICLRNSFKALAAT